MNIFRQHKIVLFSILLTFTLALSAFPQIMAQTQTSSTAPPSLLPNEVTQYQNQTLTPIDQYIAYLKAHPNVAIKGTQYINQRDYKLAVTGLVNNPANYSYTEVVNLNSTLQVATLPCIEGWSVDLLWEGVPVIDILEYAGGVSSDANTVIFYASDGYSSSLPLDYIIENNIILAYKMNNLTLTPQTGWPFFLVAKDQYGYKWVEWITEINVSDNSDYRGYWESRGYPNNATVSSGQSMTSLDYSAGVLFLGGFIVFALVVAVLINRKDQRKSCTKVYKQALNIASLY